MPLFDIPVSSSLQPVSPTRQCLHCHALCRVGPVICRPMYVRDGLHLSGTGAAVFPEGLSGAVTSGLGKVRYLN